MAEYIEREAVIEFGEQQLKRLDDGEAYRRLDAWLNSAPAADVRPVVRGRWTRIDYEPHGHDYKCSACGWKNDMPTHFCPNCGADMREEN